MFNSLTSKLKDVFTSIGKKPSIKENDLKEVLSEIRKALLEADVAFDLTKVIVSDLEQDLLGKEIQKSISPKQVIMKSFYDVIFNILGEKQDLIVNNNGLTNIMLVGLQGSGKTTTTAKIAYYIAKDKRVLLVSLDFNRLAAYSQLQVLAQTNDFGFYEYDVKDLKKVIEGAKNYAKTEKYDAIIFDTAGRLHIDEELLKEMEIAYNLIKPTESLLVIDANLGQISLDVSQGFKERIKLTGIIASKTDSDTKGGAIISCRYITNVPIKFLGTGEKVNDLEVFDAKKIADRLLDQGDILTLVEQFENIEKKEADDLEKRLSKGIFTLEDFKKQINMMKKLGGPSNLLGMLPGMGGLKPNLAQIKQAEEVLKKNVAIINSMTKQERRKANILDFSRKKRIAAGSGTTLQDINILLKQYEQASKMLRTMKKAPLKNIKKGVQKNNGKLDMKSLMNFSKKVK